MTRAMTLRRIVRLAILAVLSAPRTGKGQSSPDSVAATARYASAAAALDRFVRHEMDDKRLPAVSIALVRGQTVVWARGCGMANPKDSTRATANTVFRVGSVSKLFTDIAVMQLVEQGTLDLDAPVSRYLPDFHPQGAGASAITLRELMAHRAGLVREPPVGHYFDASSPSLVATVGSMNDTHLVYAPATKTKYSNAGIAVVGQVVASVTGQPFATYLATAVLQPMGLSHSAFEPTDRKSVV